MKDKTREIIRSTIKSKNFTDEEKTAFFIDFIKCYEDKISDLEQKNLRK